MAIIKVKTGGITADAITDALIADDVVGTEHLTANEVDTTALGADAVTGAQLADDAVNSEHYADGSIDTAHIAADQITKAKLATEVDIFAGTSLTAADLGSGIHIRTGDSSASVSSDADLLVLEEGGDTGCGITFASGTSSAARINFADSGDNDIGQIKYAHDDNSMSFTTNTAVGMTLDSSGHVTKPKQPAFQVVPASNQTIEDDTQEVVIWGTERFDVGSNFANNVFTAPVTGKYAMNVLFYLRNLDTDMNQIAGELLTSNKAYYFQFDTDGIDATMGYQTQNINVIADMDAGDTAQVKLSIESGSNLLHATDGNWSGMLIG